MNNNVSKQYGLLKPIERFRLVLAASERKDDADLDKLKASGKLLQFAASDDYPYQRAFISLAHWTFMGVLEEAADYRELLDYATFMKDLETKEVPEDEDDCLPRPWRHVMFQGYIFRTRYKGWLRFCKGLGVSPFTLWKDYPGFTRLDATFVLSGKMSFRREGFVRTVLKRQEITADDIAKCPLTPKAVALELKEMFREMVGRKGA